MAFGALRLSMQKSQSRLEARATTPAPGRGARQRACAAWPDRALWLPLPPCPPLPAPSARSAQPCGLDGLTTQPAHAGSPRPQAVSGVHVTRQSGTGTARTRAYAYRLGERRYKYQLPPAHSPCLAVLLLWPCTPSAVAAVSSCCGHSLLVRRKWMAAAATPAAAAAMHSCCGRALLVWRHLVREGGASIASTMPTWRGGITQAGWSSLPCGACRPAQLVARADARARAGRAAGRHRAALRRGVRAASCGLRGAAGCQGGPPRQHTLSMRPAISLVPVAGATGNLHASRQAGMPPR